ncbi:MAG TPA: sulfite exporter TauE/SafE family protein [Luteibaculaceae bacterium]|nr:sulfite exporter TauE/SafE family protein [Luteibaculaceae bacterium]
MSFQTIIILVCIGLLAGVLSGFVGVGGGVVIVPALAFFLGLSQHEAQGTSLALLMTPVGLFAVMNYYKAGNVNIVYALTIAVGFVVGAFFGSKLSLKLPEDTVKKVFGLFMLIMSLKLIFSK